MATQVPNINLDDDHNGIRRYGKTGDIVDEGDKKCRVYYDEKKFRFVWSFRVLSRKDRGKKQHEPVAEAA